MTPSIYRSIGQCAIGAAASLVIVASAHAQAKVTPLTERLSIAGQVTAEQLAELKARGFTAIIALRPDGEGPDQPSAALMSEAARQNGLTFTFIPVAPGPIPDSAVTALGQALAAGEGKTLLYCRSGSRAARTWGLAEASRPGGADADSIVAAVKASGQSADDLRAAIAARVAARAAGK